MVMMTLAMAMTFTSCDEDVDQANDLDTSCDEDVVQAYDLNGTWKGWIKTTRMSDRFNYYEENWETEIVFVHDGDSLGGGYGVEYDWSPRGYNYVNEFEWHMRNDRIYMYYDDGTDIVIDRYSQSRDRFSGIFCDARTYDEIASFQLIKTSDNRYWAPTRSANPAATDSIKGPRK